MSAIQPSQTTQSAPNILVTLQLARPVKRDVINIYPKLEMDVSNLTQDNCMSEAQTWALAQMSKPEHKGLRGMLKVFVGEFQKLNAVYHPA